ncbi:MAG: 30S ribosomal protein S12 methylthiotransferase RimO [Mariniphaga sp.]|nr:30S ribosomal protein S12 methylthiotransferase RimO [Mariniphaga sp.]MDD4224898.1 30S ribosomal protein S12 methylthiotransferase RimO [Mariniphaga sp.]MDD4426011.1 30S ribosomal protein S12 methylthiotransferase RimO [Mariniphaga sp.]
MKKKRVNVITMGCSKNLVDSEVLLNQLELGNFEVYHDSNETGFDVVIVNTCGFIHDAKQESIDMILDCVESKRHGDLDKVFVMGCLSERYRQELEQEIPEVDRFFGKFDLKEILSEMKVPCQSERIHHRKLTTPSHYAYLKISEGCNRACAFCAIPMMTGKMKSRPLESLVQEAQILASHGVREILLIAQELSGYGVDLYRKTRLHDLVDQISELEGIEWIRLHYLYPSKFPYKMLSVMRDNHKVCNYLDIPLQHIANPVLKNMRRQVTREATAALIERVRSEVPGVALRTTLLVGFPGETDADFQELKQFIIETKFDRLGVFPYSHEEGTFAAKKFADSIPDEVKQARANEIMEIQQQISAELNRQKIGQTIQVILDRKEEDYYVGRTEYDSPEVDGEVFVTSSSNLKIGAFYQVIITGAEEYDLFGSVVPSPPV